MLSYTESHLDIKKVAKIIKEGSTICYPTETLYGLGCNCEDQRAIDKIYDIKKREKEKNFTLLFKDLNMLSDNCETSDSEARLINKFSPGPFSIVLKVKKQSSINSKIISPNKEVCCRISSHPFVIRLFEVLDTPIVSTSANLSGNNNIFLFKTIYNTFHNLVDCIIDYGDINKSLGSTIVKETSSDLAIIREGDLSSSLIMDFYDGKS